MHLQQLLTLSSFIILGNTALGVDLDRDDVPNQCWSVCGQVVGITHKCEGQHDNDDKAEMQCICDWNQASSLIPLCEACIAQYRESNNDNDPHDNDAYDIIQSCSFSTTSYAAATQTGDMTSTTGTGTTTMPSSTNTNTPSSNDDDDDDDDDSDNDDDDSDDDNDDDQNSAPASSISKAASLVAIISFGIVGLL